ncbi:MAG: SufD family Fe-S cluster assembly protein [Bacilli bacterium]|nr:SufD family Fe-S cluster assembly protein [Bacilli bacterium]
MMNKIIIDNDLTSLENNEYNIEFKKDNITLNIVGNVVINDINSSNLNLIINLEDNSNLTFNKLNNNAIDKMNITINQSNNSKCRFNYSLIANRNIDIIVTNHLMGNDSLGEFIFRTINKDGNVYLKSTGIVDKDTKNNEILEDLKGLSITDKYIEMKPELLIDTEEVVANHKMIVSNINKTDLFNLQCKGLSKDVASKLIENGFIYKNLPDSFK